MSLFGIIGLVFFIGTLFVFIAQIRAHSNIYSLVSLGGALILSIGLALFGFQVPIGAATGAGLWVAFVFIAILIVAALSMFIFSIISAIKARASSEASGGSDGSFVPLGIALVLLIVIGFIAFVIIAVGSAMG